MAKVEKMSDAEKNNRFATVKHVALLLVQVIKEKIPDIESRDFAIEDIERVVETLNPFPANTKTEAPPAPEKPPLTSAPGTEPTTAPVPPEPAPSPEVAAS